MKHLATDSVSGFLGFFTLFFFSLSFTSASQLIQSFPSGASYNKSACQLGRYKRCVFDPWVRKTPRGGHGNPLQYSCLGNFMDRRAQQARVYGVSESDTTEYSTAQSTQLISLIYTSCGFFIFCIPASFPAALLPYDSREK